MLNKGQKHIYTAVPKRGLQARTLLWFVIGFSVVALLGSVWFLSLLGGTIRTEHSFVGQLSPDSDPIILTLPQGAILQDIHTAENDDVRKGETVATLDIDAMQRRIQAIKVELLHDDMLRRCILHSELPNIAHFADLPANAQDQARLARQDCEAFMDEQDTIRERLEKNRALITQERDLIDGYITVLDAEIKGNLLPQLREENARQMLALAILRNKLDRQIADVSYGADKEEAEWQKMRLERLRDLVAKIRSNTDLQQHISALLEQPRLQAPASGFVVQVRQIPRDTVMSEDVDLLVLRPEDGSGYRASFEVPHHLLDAVSTGDRVQLKMLGMLDWGPALGGQVSSLQTTGQTAVRATVVLDNESITQLDDPQIGVALRGLGTASIIQVKKENVKTLPVLEDIATKGFLQPGNGWFVSRFFSAPRSPRLVEVRG